MLFLHRQDWAEPHHSDRAESPFHQFAIDEWWYHRGDARKPEFGWYWRRVAWSGGGTDAAEAGHPQALGRGLRPQVGGVRLKRPEPGRPTTRWVQPQTSNG
jgi:hypothetical protein